MQGWVGAGIHRAWSYLSSAERVIFKFPQSCPADQQGPQFPSGCALALTAGKGWVRSGNKDRSHLGHEGPYSLKQGFGVV